MNSLELPESALATAKHVSRSDAYVFISTKDVVSFAEARGWRVVKSDQARIKKNNRLGFQKHIVIMEKDGAIGRDGKIQLCIRNSHDGSSGLQLFLGYMRIVCNNQLFAKNLGQGMDISIRHSKSGLRRLNEFLDGFDVAVSLFAEKIDKMVEKILTPDQVRVFTEKALGERFKADVINDVVIENATISTRPEDDQNNLWNVMNRVQERLVSGNISIVNPVTKKMKKVRKLSSIDTLVALNSNLIELASSYL